MKNDEVLAIYDPRIGVELVASAVKSRKRWLGKWETGSNGSQEANSGVPFTTEIGTLEGCVELTVDWSLVRAVVEGSLVSAMGPQ
jgi:hypothetical protein